MADEPSFRLVEAGSKRSWFPRPTPELLMDQLHNPDNCDLFILCDPAKTAEWVRTHRPNFEDVIECTCVPEHWMRRAMRESLERAFSHLDEEWFSPQEPSR